MAVDADWHLNRLQTTLADLRQRRIHLQMQATRYLPSLILVLRQMDLPAKRVVKPDPMGFKAETLRMTQQRLSFKAGVGLRGVPDIQARGKRVVVHGRQCKRIRVCQTLTLAL